MDLLLEGETKMALAIALLVGAIAAMGLCVFFVEPLWALAGLERITPNLVYRVPTDEPLVGLSFDDGPHTKFTPQVLEILERHGAKATFFLIGERALREPDLVARIRAAGHELGNHYFENGPTLFHSDVTFLKKLEETEKVIGFEASRNRSGENLAEKENASTKERSGHPPATAGRQKCDLTQEPGKQKASAPALFRPPGGVAWPWQLRLAKARGYACVLGCAYPHDPMRPPIAYMRWLIKKNLRPGTIVILHDGIADARKSIEVLPQILADGRKRGLKFVSIGELMKQDG